MVDSGPAAIAQTQYSPDNYLYVTVTVCQPGTTTCANIDHVLVSTQTSGLRVLSSEVTGVPLTPEKDPAAAGNTLAECIQLPSGTAWGNVVTADVKVGGETASSVPIQVLSAPAATPNAANCADNGFLSSVQSLAANGVIGLGPLAQDCSGTSCVSQYFTCNGNNGNCQLNVSAAPGVGSEVTNPATKFAKDNNGVIVELPTVPAAGLATLTGQLIFGIGTESNNAFSGTKVMLPANATTGAITTTYTSQTAGSTPVQYTNSWFDTGSYGNWFTDAGITACPNKVEYCPAQTLSLSATVTSPVTATDTATVPFSVANADNLTSTNIVFSTIGGPTPTSLVGSLTGASVPFIWGLPFFMGHNVFIGYTSASVTSGTTTVKGPFYAY